MKVPSASGVNRTSARDRGATIERARALPDEKRHAPVGGEWSCVETVRHLVCAIDKWLPEHRPLHDCVGVVFEEHFHHLRDATRDLDLLDCEHELASLTIAKVRVRSAADRLSTQSRLEGARGRRCHR